ncbi:amidohydrolase family protein [Rhizorhabdus sp.]|uniref:N-acyl-D-amino-acid deacylase family protein n=1 Tax=Rhizorhabdus sp. TaxID=1968843 RepID=UPI0035B2A306
MQSILLKGGTVVDGTGKPAIKADVRVKGDTIVDVGPDLTPGDDRVIDCTGCFVTPGFIEPHTHFDATMWWQPDLDPLTGYGVTTIVMGNCGFSAAPVHETDAEARLEMIKIFSFFEDIPEEPFLTKLPWDWRKWSEYQRSMTDKLRVPANYTAFVGHIAIRLAVMGMDAWERKATPEEIRQIAAHVDDALAAGACGVSSNLLDHDGSDRPVPTQIACDDEYRAILEVLARYPGRSLQVVIDTFMRMTAPASMERLTRLNADLNVRIQLAGGIPTLEFQRPILEQMRAIIEKAHADGQDVWPAFTHTSPTNTLSLIRSLIFAQSNDYVWHEVVLLEDLDEKVKLLQDPDWRARARESWDTKVWPHAPMANPDRLLLRNSDNGFGPVNTTLKAYADSRGLHPSDAMAEWILANGIRSTVHMAPFDMNRDEIIRLIRDPKALGNLNDAPAHGQMFCGGGENILMLTDYVRKGELSIEEAVLSITGRIAEHFGFTDRGRIAPGMRADITVFDLDEIEHREEYKRFDVPTGGYDMTWRYTRDAAPMRLTMVNGMPTFMNGHFTGSMPGRYLVPAGEQQLAQAAE